MFVLPTKKDIREIRVTLKNKMFLQNLTTNSKTYKIIFISKAVGGSSVFFSCKHEIKFSTHVQDGIRAKFVETHSNCPTVFLIILFMKTSTYLYAITNNDVFIIVIMLLFYLYIAVRSWKF